jgi:hypothetical protein
MTNSDGVPSIGPRYAPLLAEMRQLASNTISMICPFLNIFRPHDTLKSVKPHGGPRILDQGVLHDGASQPHIPAIDEVCQPYYL